MAIRQERESLDQVIQTAEDRYQQVFDNLDINADIKGKNFKVKLYPLFENKKGVENVKINVLLENNDHETKNKFNLSRLLPIDLETLSDLLGVDYNEVKDYIFSLKNENQDYLSQEAKAKNVNGMGIDNYIGTLLTGYLIKISGKTDEEIRDILSSVLSEEVNKLIRNALLEEKNEEYSKVYDYAELVRQIGVSDKYIVLYDGSAKVIFNTETGETVKFYGVDATFVGNLLSDKRFKGFITNTSNSEEEMLKEFKQNLPDKLDLGKNKIKKETFNRIINNYLSVSEQLGDLPYLVLKVSPSGTEYKVLYADENGDLVVVDL